MIRKSIIAMAAAAAVMSSAAYALVTFDPATGQGFVGKGDIQLLTGWNDQALQKNAGDVSFVFAAEEEYKFDCTFTVEVGRDKVLEPRTQNRGRETSVNSSVALETRVNKLQKVTGFVLNGFGEDRTVSGELLVDGGHCPGGQFNDGVISNITLMSSTGGLYAVINGQKFAL